MCKYALMGTGAKRMTERRKEATRKILKEKSKLYRFPCIASICLVNLSFSTPVNFCTLYNLKGDMLKKW